jgi:hypothetical protein
MGLRLAFVLSVLAAPAEPQVIEVAPLVGSQFGGNVYSPYYGQSFSVGNSFTYGGTLDVAITRGWRAEMLFSRQATDLRAWQAPGPQVHIALERYMIGIEEVKNEEEPARPFGVFLLGATRFVPGLDGYSSDTLFTLGLSLGVKVFPWKKVGFRFEGRGFYTPINSSGSLACRCC